MRRLFPLVMLSTLFFSIVNITLAQGNIPPAVDTVMTDLSQRLGKKIDRETVNWTYSEELFSNAGLGCPDPGTNYQPESIKGYIITIDVDSVTYDYRYSEKDNTFFLCSPKTAPTPTPLPILIPQATSTPLPPTVIPTRVVTTTPVPPRTLHVDAPVFAYINFDGSLNITGMSAGAAAPVAKSAFGGNDLDKLLADPVTASSYGFLRWSPDGTRLMFNDLPNRSINVIMSSQAPVTIVKDYGLDLDLAVNGAWSSDGSRIAYVAGSTGNMHLDVISAGGTDAGAVTAIPTCSPAGSGINTSDPASVAFALDSDLGKLFTASSLFWLNQDAYLLEVGSCQMLMLLSPSGLKWNVDNITSVAVSPDRTRIAAVRVINGAPTLVSIDLASGNAQPIPGVAQQVDQVAWSADGNSIVYSTLSSLGFTTGDAQNALGQQIFGPRWPIQAQSNSVGLWSVPATGGTPTQFFSWEGYRIASIVPNSAGVMVSFISSARTMLRWISEGRSKDVVAMAAPHPEIFLARFDNPIPLRMGYGGQPAISAGQTFEALVPAGTDFMPVSNQQCQGAPPSRLVVGQPAHITPGDPNSMRSSPTGPVVGSIPGGSTVTVLGGPACSDKGVAWWQVDFKGIKGWTAEGQGTSYYVEP